MRGYVGKLVQLLVALLQGAETGVQGLGHAVEGDGQAAQVILGRIGDFNRVVALHHLLGQFPNLGDAPTHLRVDRS